VVARIGRVAVSKLADKSGRGGSSFPFMHRTLAAFQLTITDLRSTPALFVLALWLLAAAGCCNPLVLLCLSASLPLCLSASLPLCLSASLPLCLSASQLPPPSACAPLPRAAWVPVHSLLCYTFTLFPSPITKLPSRC
jgi:hypothetical protein